MTEKKTQKILTELDEFFVYKCKKGLKARGLADKPEYVERLEYEMKVILDMEFPGYFLVVHDIIDYARRNNIHVGPGRGSVVGSLVAYSLGISNLDPLKYGLIFERFLNPERISMPDVDMDFDKQKRDQVIQYVIDKYGKDKVGHIGTFGVLRAKNAVRSVAKVLGADYATGDALSKMLLNPVHGKPQSLKTSFEKVVELGSKVKEKTLEGSILRASEMVENLNKSIGSHASGIVIANQPLVELVPLFRGKDGKITTQWEMNNIEQIGLVKFDFLGLNALSKVSKCVSLIKKKDPDFDLDTIPLDDKLTYDKLCSGEVQGLFQLEDSSGVRDLIMQIAPKNLEDICAVVSIYRPGPLAAPYKEIYLAVRQGLRDPEYLIPEMKPILGKTSGWLIYQEQVLQIARDLCGYTMGQADNLRKAIGKKKADVMQAEEARFKKGWADNGYDVDKANILWKEIDEFANYSFNKSHGIAYALITYQTAFLKANYPVEFMCAIMSCENNKDSIIKYIGECKRLGIKLLPPDINESGKEFEIDSEGNIRFGLAPIKNIGESVNTIIEERANRKFSNLYDFCNRIDMGIINRKKLESLILSGCFDSTGHNRATLLASVEDIWNHRDAMKSYSSKLETYEKKQIAYDQRLEDMKTNAKLKAFKVPVKPERPPSPSIKLTPEMDSITLLAAEHELLGYYISDHPLNRYEDTIKIQKLLTIENIQMLNDKAPVQLGAVITNKNEITNKRKQKQAFLVIEDTTGQMEATVFAGTYSKFSDLLEKNIPLKFNGQIEIVEARGNQEEDTDEVDESIRKLIVKSVEPLKELHLDRQEIIELEIGLDKLQSLSNILVRRPGKNRITISVKNRDGSIIKLPSINSNLTRTQLDKEMSELDGVN